MQPLSTLRDIPEGVTHAAGLITGLDDAFAVGFGRLGEGQLRALDALGRAFAGTPLAGRLAEGLAAVKRNELVEKHFAAFAAARTALQGAQHDALSGQAAAALGRAPGSEPPAVAESAQAAPSHHEVFLESARQWLMEIAVAGFLQLTPETVLPFSATLEKIQSEPSLVRQGALLTGLFNELLGAMPVATMPEVPLFRWVDLWSRAMVLAIKAPTPLRAEAVSGELVPLGADVRQHANFASAVVYGLLKGGDGKTARVVRATISAYKVDVIQGAEMWSLLATSARQLLTALGKRLPLKIKDMQLLSSGDLVWNDKNAQPGGASDVMAEAAKWLAPGATGVVLPSLAPGDRHPAQIAEPVFLEGSRGLDIDAERLGGVTDFGADEAARSQKMVGLLRFDGGRWAVQPLAFTPLGKRDVLMAGSNGATQGVGGGSGRDGALGTLRERAGKLLRAK